MIWRDEPTKAGLWVYVDTRPDADFLTRDGVEHVSAEQVESHYWRMEDHLWAGPLPPLPDSGSQTPMKENAREDAAI